MTLTKEEENLLEVKYKNMTYKELLTCMSREAAKDGADPLLKALSSRLNNVLYELRTQR